MIIATMNQFWQLLTAKKKFQLHLVSYNRVEMERLSEKLKNILVQFGPDICQIISEVYVAKSSDEDLRISYSEKIINFEAVIALYNYIILSIFSFNTCNEVFIECYDVDTFSRKQSLENAEFTDGSGYYFNTLLINSLINQKIYPEKTSELSVFESRVKKHIKDATTFLQILKKKKAKADEESSDDSDDSDDSDSDMSWSDFDDSDSDRSWSDFDDSDDSDWAQ